MNSEIPKINWTFACIQSNLCGTLRCVPTNSSREAGSQLLYAFE